VPVEVAVKDKTAADLMTTQVLTVAADWTVDRVAEFFVENGISGAPVVGEDGSLVGVVSMTDIVRNDMVPVKTQVDHPHDYYLHSLETIYAKEELASFRIGKQSQTTASDIMTPSIFEVAKTTAVQEVADVMVRGRIHRVFVTDDDNMVGVISALDMLKAFRDS
jgi:CBS domain-containing protein